MIRILVLSVPILVVGCGKSPDATQSTVPTAITVSIPNAASTTANANVMKEVVEKFLASKTPAEQMTVAFKTIIAEPVFDSDKARGYSDVAATSWVKANVTLLGTTQVSTPYVTETWALAWLQGPANSGIIRLIQDDKKNWLVDWFQVTTAKGGRVAEFPKNNTAGLQEVAVKLFLDPLFMQHFELVEAVLTAELKAKIGPPLGSDSTRGYNRGAVRSKLAEWVKGYTDYKITSIEAGIARGVLTNASSQKPFILRFQQVGDTAVGLISEFTTE